MKTSKYTCDCCDKKTATATSIRPINLDISFIICHSCAFKFSQTRELKMPLYKSGEDNVKLISEPYSNAPDSTNKVTMVIDEPKLNWFERQARIKELCAMDNKPYHNVNDNY